MHGFPPTVREQSKTQGLTGSLLILRRLKLKELVYMYMYIVHTVDVQFCRQKRTMYITQANFSIKTTLVYISGTSAVLTYAVDDAHDSLYSV